MWKLGLLVVLAIFGCVVAIPSSHIIPNVPYHRQTGNWSCGAASLEMVINYWGEHVPELVIADVARTDPKEGTLSVDVVRTLKFSRMSSSVGNYFSNSTSQFGFPGHPRGLASFWHDAKQPWLDEAFAIIAQDVPMIVLTLFDPYAKKREGHFRVLIGYDYDASTVTLYDPMGGEGTPPVLVWPFTTFLAAWNYTEGKPTPRVNPFFGAIGYPWNITVAQNYVSADSIMVQATVHYPLFPPMIRYPSPASMVLVSINTTENLRVSPNSLSQVYLPSLAPLESAIVKWSLMCLDPTSSCEGQNVTITGEGMIWGNQPLEPVDRESDYPPYDWVDVIGAQTTVTLTGKNL